MECVGRVSAQSSGPGLRQEETSSERTTPFPALLITQVARHESEI